MAPPAGRAAQIFISAGAGLGIREPSAKTPADMGYFAVQRRLPERYLHLEMIEEFGNTLREPNSKAMGDGLFELRIKFSSDITRIFYFFYVENKIILTNGFVKKTPKTPPAQLELARKYKADYERRHSHE